MRSRFRRPVAGKAERDGGSGGASGVTVIMIGEVAIIGSLAMPRKERRRKPADEHTHIAIRVERYEVCAEGSVNSYAYAPQYAWRDTEEEPLYRSGTTLEIAGTVIDPEERAGHIYELTIYGEDSPSSNVYARLKDVQARDEYNAPRYREYRGKHIPVYVAPKGRA